MRPNLSSVPRSALAALVLQFALVPAPALAEATPAPSSAPRFIEQPQTGTMRGSKVIGVSVIGADHVRVGKIEDVLVNGDGRIEAVVIGVGGFLGIGEKDVAVPFQSVEVTRMDGKNRMVLRKTKDELKNAPTFTEADATPATTGSVNNNNRPATTPPATAPAAR